MNTIGFQYRLNIYKHTSTCHLSGTVLRAKTQTMLLESYHESCEKLWSWSGVFGWVKMISTEATSSMHVWPISWHHRQEKSSYLASSLLPLPIKLIYTGKSLKTLPCRHIFCLQIQSDTWRETFCYRLIRLRWWNAQIPALRLWSQARVGMRAGSLAIMSWLWVKLYFSLKCWASVSSSTKPIWFEDKC